MSGTGHTVKSYEEEMQSLNDNLVTVSYTHLRAHET